MIVEKSQVYYINMIYELNDDVILEIIRYVDEDEIIFLQETCTFFYNIIPRSIMKFPHTDILFSNVKLLQWAIDHHYRVNQVRMFRIAIQNGNCSVLDFLYEKYQGYNFLTPKIFNLALDQEDLDILQWLSDKKCNYVKNSVLEKYYYIENIRVKKWLKKMCFSKQKKI